MGYPVINVAKSIFYNNTTPFVHLPDGEILHSSQVVEWLELGLGEVGVCVGWGERRVQILLERCIFLGLDWMPGVNSNLNDLLNECWEGVAYCQKVFDSERRDLVNLS